MTRNTRRHRNRGGNCPFSERPVAPGATRREDNGAHVACTLPMDRQLRWELPALELQVHCNRQGRERRRMEHADQMAGEAPRREGRFTRSRQTLDRAVAVVPARPAVGGRAGVPMQTGRRPVRRWTGGARPGSREHRVEARKHGVGHGLGLGGGESVQRVQGVHGRNF